MVSFKGGQKMKKQKTVTKIKPKAGVTAEPKVNELTLNQAMMQAVLNNMLVDNTSYTLRREVIQRLLSGQRDIDTECKYPSTITTENYKAMFDRNGLAERVVKLWPEECWQSYPDVYETEDPKETKFEAQVKELMDSVPVWNILYRADVLSGIGQFGIIILGINDGNRLEQELNFKQGRGKGRQLLYLHPLDQSVVEVIEKETDTGNPRYGKPKLYSVTFESDTSVGGTAQKSGQGVKVHWTRVIHLADNRTTSDINGVPRMKSVYNYLLDVKKVAAGSGEMFWKGGLPGFGFSLTPKAQEAGAEIDDDVKKTMKEEVYKYFEGLQRYILLQNMEINSLAPQVVEPTSHFKCQIQLVCITLGIPYRIFVGTEEAKLASSQDKTTWNERLKKRRENYLTPMVVRPFFDRLIDLGVLEEPKEYFVRWPDLEQPTEGDIADVAAKRTEAFAKYEASGASSLIAPRQYWTLIHKMTDEEADAIEKGVKQQEEEMEPEEEPVEEAEEV